MILITFVLKMVLETRPESGLDRLVCSEFARQRNTFTDSLMCVDALAIFIWSLEATAMLLISRVPTHHVTMHHVVSRYK